MAIDTRNKRASSLGFGLLALVSPPAPDGTIDAADRAHIMAMYAGITVDAPLAIEGVHPKDVFSTAPRHSVFTTAGRERVFSTGPRNTVFTSE